MSIEIASLIPEDAEQFIDALNQFSEGAGFTPEVLYFYNARWSASAITAAARDQNQVLIVARELNAPAGVVLGAVPEGGVATLIWLLVAPERRRMGIGALLFGEASRRYADMGCHKIKLTTPSLAAVRFYEGQGMKIEGKHRNHWWHMDFWSMGMTIRGDQCNLRVQPWHGKN